MQGRNAARQVRCTSTNTYDPRASRVEGSAVRNRKILIQFFAVFFMYLGTWQGKHMMLIWSDDLSQPSRIIAVPDVAPVYEI